MKEPWPNLDKMRGAQTAYRENAYLCALFQNKTITIIIHEDF